MKKVSPIARKTKRLPRTIICRKIRNAIVASCCVLLANIIANTQQARAQTLQQALEASWSNNIAFALEKRKVQEVFEKARRAAIDLGPVFNLQGSYGLQAQRQISENDATSSSSPSASQSLDPSQAWRAEVTVEQSLLQSGQVYSTYAIASYDRKIALLRLREFEAQLILDGLQRYLGVVESSAALRVGEKSESQLYRQWQSVRREANLGGASARDVALATASLAEARAQTIDARNSDAAARRTFTDHFGIGIEGKLETPQNLPKIPQDIETAQALMLDNNFNLRAARLEFVKQKRVARSTRGLVFLPRMVLKAGYNIAEQNSNTVDSFYTQLTFSYPLRPAYFMSGYRSVLNGLRLARDGARLAEQNARRKLLDVWEALSAARESEKAREETLQARSIVLKSAQRETKLGTGDIDDLLEAERNFAEAERATIVAKRKTLVAQVQLLKVIGTLSPARLQLDVPPFDAKHFRRWGFSVEP